MQLSESKTIQNLANAFAGETQARTRYEFVEYGLRKAGYTTLAEIVDKIAYQEFNHARMLYTYIQKSSDKPIENIDVSAGYPFREKWDVQENLKLAAEDERTESEQVYPSYAEIAQKEGFDDVAKLFSMLSKVERTHMEIFTQLYEKMKKGDLYTSQKPVEWTCSACGYSHKSLKAWQTCPLCGAKQTAVQLDLQ